ncbi:protein NLRC3-like isoform X2 [Acropora muricata]|uniref:protein NLRC3-like isoform X2 n=1 Tax=Acropora muricata TaxID=159855 RepID=UPI0034E4C470
MGDKEHVMEPSECHHSLDEYGVASEDKKPPQLSFKLKKTGDVPKCAEKWSDVHLPIDILLLTSVESSDFLSCFSFLDQPFKSYKFGIGYVYFGRIGDVSDQEKLKVALINCSKGAAAPGGSLTVVLNAVKVLQPKAVFSVGTCISLGLEKARMGDVVISSKLSTAEGFITPGSPLLGSLVRDAPYGWDAPLKNPEEWEVKVHCSGDILSQSLTEKCQNVNIWEQYPKAVAIETEGEGVYAAAYDANIEWVIVKGVASHFHQSQSATSEWMSFASAMAASVVAKMLKDPAVFREWRHYNQENRGKRPIHPLGITTPKRRRQNAALPKKNRGKRPIHPVGTTTSKRRRQNAAIPETDGDISKVAKLLEKEYIRRADFSPLLWSKGMKLELKEVYTRLRVVSKRKARSSEIDLDDIFGSSEEDNDPLVLVEGSPGIGKTTFCLKLAHDWANGAMPRNFPSFKLVFLLKCRDIIKDVVEEIFEQLLPEDLEEKIKEALANFLEDLDNQKQILIILDGLDELPEKLEDCVNKVLGRKKLSFCYVLATTRQEKGIETREQFKFDSCLAIEGFSEENSFEYIRKHFRNIGTEHSYKGERLIEEIKRNPLLRHLQSNPLNLLLLCVVYEDHKGSLPSSMTALYQTIVRCLLRRYCARDELKAAKKDEDLDKQFEIPILALGDLAGKCLLNDELSFYEDELEELERSIENIVARRLGLVYKEESVRRLKPRHAYNFLHKTFQEYLVASHIAHKFRRSEFQMLEQMLFPESGMWKFKQVFVFVCGILREKASILFEQIGKMLQEQWDWLKCDELTAFFFVDGWKETGNAQRMAKTLCSFLPFPRLLPLWKDEHYDGICYVLKECAEFPEELTVAEVHVSQDFRFPGCGHYLLKLPGLKSLILHQSIHYEHGFEDLNKTLLEKLTFALFADTESKVSKVPDFGVSSVRLRICGSLGSFLLQEVENLLLHKCLCSLSITVCGDVQESLLEALARGLAGESAVKFLDLCINGNFSFRGASLLKQGILRNRSLTNIKVSVNGEPPENWQAVSKSLRAQFAEKANVSESYPNTLSKVKDSQVTHLSWFLSKTDLKQKTATLNVWGELSSDGCKAVCEVLLRTPLSHLTLNIHGQLTDEMLRYIARFDEEHEKLLPITINAWVEVTEKESKLIKELGLDKNPLFLLNVRGTSAPSKESDDSKVVSRDEPQCLIAFSEKATKGPSKFAEDTSQKSLTIKINELEYGLGEGLAGNTSLKFLTLEIECYYDDNDEWGRGLGEGLARNTSLESLTIKSRPMTNKWVHGLGEGLAGNTSLKSLTLEIDFYYNGVGEWGCSLGEGLARNTSLESLTIKCRNRTSKWGHCLGEGLAGNTSLKLLTLAIDGSGDDIMMDGWGRCLGEGLARNTSLESLTIKIKTDYTSSEWEYGLGEGLAGNTSLKSLTLEIDGYYDIDPKGGSGLGEGLARNTSLESLTLTTNCHYNGDEWGHPLGENLAENNSLNSLTLTINNYCSLSDEWGVALAEGLARNTSLKSITFTINNYFYVSSVWGLGLLEGSVRNMSLKSITLAINNYGIMKGERRQDIIKSLARNASLTSITLAINNYGEMEGECGHCLFESLARNTSLNSLTLTANNYGDSSEEWGCALRESLRKRETLTERNLIVDICGKF